MHITSLVYLEIEELNDKRIADLIFTNGKSVKEWLPVIEALVNNFIKKNNHTGQVVAIPEIVGSFLTLSLTSSWSV